MYENSCAPKIRNDRVQESRSPETNRELRPHFQLHSSAKQTKHCVLETQPVGGFSSAVGLCTTVSFPSPHTEQHKPYMLREIKKPPSFSHKEFLSSSICLRWMLSRFTRQSCQRALMIIILKWLKCSAKAVYHTETHTHTQRLGCFLQQQENISSPWDLGFSSPECGRQTGFHTPLLGRIEPLVNSPVLKAEQRLNDWLTDPHLLQQSQPGLAIGFSINVWLEDHRLEWHLVESA